MADRGGHRPRGADRHHDLPQPQLQPPTAERSGAAQSLGRAWREGRDGPRRGRHQRRPRHAAGDAPRAAPAPRARHGRTSCPRVRRCSRMATEDGAATTPYAGAHRERFAPGKAADVVLLSWSQTAHPYLDPDTSVVDAVVHRAQDVRLWALVMVAGEVVLRDGRFTRIDKAAALAELAASLRAPLTPEEEGAGAACRVRSSPFVQAYSTMAGSTRTPARRSTGPAHVYRRRSVLASFTNIRSTMATADAPRRTGRSCWWRRRAR